MQPRPPKILIVSNEIRGLGHVNIALKISACIQAELRDVSILLLTASPMVHAFPLPQGLDVIKIPTVVRSEGSLTSFRSLRLPLAFEEVKRLRQRVIREAALTYSPELVLVDYRPAGVRGELLSTLRALKRRRQGTLVLLLRDILDDPAILRTKWRADLALSALQEYDEIWVYGCQNHHDPIREHQFPETVARKVRFCGYLDIGPQIVSGEEIRRSLGVAELLVLVTIGNGRVGFPVLEAYVRALACLPSDLAVFSMIVGGPELAPGDYEVIDRQCQLVTRRYPRQRTHFTRFSPRLLDYMAAADLVVSLGGYNTVTEILSLEKRSIVVPYYTSSNKEQLIRASLMEGFGLIRMLHLDQLSPESLAESILTALQDRPPTRQRLQELGFDFGGLQRIREHVVRLIGRNAAPPVPGE
jgi:predicted glycosyltransferase